MGFRGGRTALAALAPCALLAPFFLSGAAARAADETTVGVPWTGSPGVTETVADIMERERLAPPRPFALSQVRETHPEIDLRKLLPPRQPRPAPAVSQWPPTAITRSLPTPYTPQTVGTSFLGARLSESGFIPPDSVGDVGPSQVLVAVNGRIKVFDKSGALGSLNATLNNFFASVGGTTNGTTDPHVRYDRLSGRWFITAIDLGSGGSEVGPNDVLIAVSSGSTITGTGSFTFFQFQQDSVGPAPNPDTNGFADYDTLGVDKFALYIGVNMFNQSTTAFLGTTGYVVNKASVLSGGPIVVTAFRQMAGTACPSGAGPLTPQGVSDDDPAATEGYFIGADLCAFSLLQIRRVGDPGGTPTLSANLSVTVPTTMYPIAQVQPSPGLTLDALDDRLFAAMIHENKITGAKNLWTAHNIQVDSSGVGSNTGGRNGSRWYEIGSLTTTPALVQAGTLFDPAATNPFGHWIPSVAVSGQGHMALASSRAGADASSGFASVAAAGRLRTDGLGTTRSPTLAQSSSTIYNVQMSGPQRWGDFSQTVVDPADDMTMWTFQEYCDATNSWGVRAIQLRPPPPATPVCGTPVPVTQATQDVTITGTSVGGSEFFDPGPDTGGPGYPNHLQASVSGGVTVNSVTFNSPTSVTLNVTATTSGLKDVTITNPDGQSIGGSNCIDVILGPVADLAISKTDGQATAVPGATVTYTIVASNAGPSAASGATVADTPPAAITGATWTCVGAGGGSCTASGAGSISDPVNLPPGGTVTYTLTGTIAASAAGSLSNTATVTAPGGVSDPNAANNAATDTDVLAPQADLAITKSDGQAAAPPGAPVTYTIVASNAGPDAASGATVTDTLPAAIVGATWTCVGAGGGSCTASGSGSISDAVDLPVGGTVTYTLMGTIAASATGTLSNTATVTAPGGVTDPDLTNNTDTDTDTLLGLDYFTLEPCRVVDTRGGAPIAGPVLQGQETRPFAVVGHCGIPATAKALSINVTVTQPTAQGNVRLFPADQALPPTSTLNYVAGLTRANNAIIALSPTGEMAVFVAQPLGTTVHLIIDVDGYFQ
jgi:uncharacterized repeat protein (TIGR01451 family)